MKILITGKNGYIARSIIRSLEGTYDLVTIGREDIDMTNLAAVNTWFEGKHFDVVIHTAAVGGNRLIPETAEMGLANIKMYLNLLANRDRFTKLINFGSGAELGDPTTPYGISKRALCEITKRSENFLNLRVFAVFDYDELPTRFIRSNIERYIKYEPLLVHEDKLMDFFYMKDLITLVCHFLNKEEWSVREIDCRYLHTCTLSEIAKIINKLSTYKVNIKVEKSTEKSYSGTYRGMPIPLIGLKQGIIETYNKIKQNDFFSKSK